VWILVVYDISENEKRNKVAKELLRLGLSRIQRSAFVGDIDSQRYKDLVRICSKLVDGKEMDNMKLSLNCRNEYRSSISRNTISVILNSRDHFLLLLSLHTFTNPFFNTRFGW